MTKILLLMRHGKSSWKEKGIADEKRPLKKRGEQAATMIGRTLKVNEIMPGLILSSPAKRARHTAEIVAKECGYGSKPELIDSFYMGEPANFIARLQQVPADKDHVMIVGHNPGLEAFLQLLDGKVDALPTGSLAVLRIEIPTWEALSMESNGNLIAFWDPEKKHNKS